jgi:hypothetical protein
MLTIGKIAVWQTSTVLATVVLCTMPVGSLKLLPVRFFTTCYNAIQHLCTHKGMVELNALAVRSGMAALVG